MAINSYDSIINIATDLAADADLTTSNVFDNIFLPNLEQRAEFGQQVAFQQMQNDWSVGGKMDAMKKAGINANVAAAGIAGASTPSVSSPNSAVGAGAQGVSSAAQAAGAVNEAVNAGVNAFEKLSLTGVERDKRRAEIRDLLANATHNEWLAYAVSELLPEQKRETQANTYLKLANYANAKEEFFNIQKEYEVKDADVKRIKAERDLAIKQGNLVDAEKLKVDAETSSIELDNWKKNRDKEWYDKYGYDRNNPIDNILIDGMISDNDSVVTAVGDAVKLSSYSERKGLNQAEIEDGYDKAFASLKADKDLQSEYAPYLAMIETNKQAMIDFIKMIVENPKDMRSILGKFVNLLGQFGLSNQLDNNPVNNANRPSSGNPYKFE